MWKKLEDLWRVAWLFVAFAAMLGASASRAICRALALAFMYGRRSSPPPPPTAEDEAWARWEEEEIRRLEADGRLAPGDGRPPVA